MVSLTPQQEAERGTWQYRAVEATRGNQSQLGAILICVLGDVKRRTPSFQGGATITSDGFITCDFIDKHGAFHTGAFVGSVRDLCDNFSGLADHLQLSDADRIEMFAKVRTWIKKDYRADSTLHFTKTR